MPDANGQSTRFAGSPPSYCHVCDEWYDSPNAHSRCGRFWRKHTEKGYAAGIDDACRERKRQRTADTMDETTNLRELI